MVAGCLAQLAHTGVGDRGVALLAAGGAVSLVDILHLDFGGIIQTQGQLITAQLYLNGVAHRRNLAQRDLGSGCQAHIQQVVAQLSLPADGAQHRILPDFQFCQCHMYILFYRKLSPSNFYSYSVAQAAPGCNRKHQQKNTPRKSYTLRGVITSQRLAGNVRPGAIAR